MSNILNNLPSDILLHFKLFVVSRGLNRTLFLFVDGWSSRVCLSFLFHFKVLFSNARISFVASKLYAVARLLWAVLVIILFACSTAFSGCPVVGLVCLVFQSPLWSYVLAQ